MTRDTLKSLSTDDLRRALAEARRLAEHYRQRFFNSPNDRKISDAMYGLEVLENQLALEYAWREWLRRGDHDDR